MSPLEELTVALDTPTPPAPRGTPPASRREAAFASGGPWAARSGMRRASGAQAADAGCAEPRRRK